MRIWLFLGLCWLTPLAFAEALTLAHLPRFLPEEQSRRMQPLVDFLRQETALDIVLDTGSKNFVNYRDRVLAGEIAIAFQNYPLYADNHTAQALLLETQEAGDQFAGIIITNNLSNFKTLEEVKGELILFTGRYGVGAFTSPLAALQAVGIGQDAVRLQSVAGNANENVVIGVSVGDANVGFVRDRAVLAVCQRYIQPDSVRVLAEGVTMPSPLLISVSKTLPDTVQAKIKQGFLAANNQPELLKILGIRGFAELGETAAYWSKTLDFPLP